MGQYLGQKDLNGAYRFFVWWEQVSQDKVKNTSKVRVTMGVSKFKGDTTASGCNALATLEADVGGSHSGPYTTNWAMQSLASGASRDYYDETFTITHNTDGTKRLSISGTFDPNVGGRSTGTKQTISGTVTLTTIPRATVPKLSAAAADMGGKVTVDLSGRAVSSFVHTLTYALPDGTGGTIAEKTADTAVVFTVPDFAGKLPAAVSGPVTVKCQTFNSAGTSLGSKSVTLTATVPENVKPSIPAVTVTEAAPGLAEKYGVFVQTKSRLAVAVTAAGAKGSTVTVVSSAFEGRSYAGTAWTSAPVAGAGTVSIVTTVTDSRGRTASVTTPVAVTAYTPPVITAFAGTRADAAGNEQGNGNYVRLRFAYTVPSLNGGNTAAMAVRARRSDGTGADTELVTGADLAADKTVTPRTELTASYRWDVRMTVTDSFGAVTAAEFTLPTADVIFDVKADGRGFAFGKTAEAAGFEVAGTWVLGPQLRAALLELTHPVGSYYWSGKATSPATLFGGTWERVKDVFVLAAGDTYAAGSTGGEAAHKLTVDEMPSHQHRMGISGSTATDSGRNVTTSAWKSAGSYALSNAFMQAIGGSGAHNNMPPYVAAYCWRRTR